MQKLLMILGMAFMLSTFAWAAQTTLITDAQVEGSAENAGDVFLVHVSVTNIGADTAMNVRGDLRNVPDSWIVSPPNNGSGPTNGAYSFGDLAPGETANVTYTVIRDEQEAGPIMPGSKTLWSRVFADNAPVAESGSIQVPIHPLVMGALVTAMAGSAYLMARKREMLGEK